MKKYLIDDGRTHDHYISPKMKVIEIATRNAILDSSPGSTGEDGTPISREW